MAEELTRATREADRATMTDVHDEIRLLRQAVTDLVDAIDAWYQEWDRDRVKPGRGYSSSLPPRD